MIQKGISVFMRFHNVPYTERKGKAKLYIIKILTLN